MPYRASVQLKPITVGQLIPAANSNYPGNYAGGGQLYPYTVRGMPLGRGSGGAGLRAFESAEIASVQFTLALVLGISNDATGAPLPSAVQSPVVTLHWRNNAITGGPLTVIDYYNDPSSTYRSFWLASGNLILPQPVDINLADDIRMDIQAFVPLPMPVVGGTPSAMTVILNTWTNVPNSGIPGQFDSLITLQASVTPDSERNR